MGLASLFDKVDVVALGSEPASNAWRNAAEQHSVVAEKFIQIEGITLQSASKCLQKLRF